MATMTNADIADLLARHGALLEVAGESPFKVRAYRNGADAVRHADVPVADLALRGETRSIPGIGEGLAAAIDEMVTAGRYAAFEDLAAAWPPTLVDLLDLPGVGVKTVQKLHSVLGVSDLAGLEAAAVSGRIASAKGLGPRIEATVRAALESREERSGRMPIGTALPAARSLVAALALTVPGRRIEIAGSIRRYAETAADIDLVIESVDHSATMVAIATAGVVSELERVDGSACRLLLHSGATADVFFAAPGDFGTVLVRATGPAEHLEALGEIPAHAADEAAVYAANGLPWIPPELRRDGSEFTKVDLIPLLLTVADIRGELHCHSTWSDGTAAIAAMAAAARDRGYAYLGITDHSGGLGVANGLDLARLREQRLEIDGAAEGIVLLAGSEVEVSKDGSLDFDDATLAALDVVVASLHSGLRQPREQLMERIERVLRNPNVDIVAHPSGRLIERRPPGDFDWPRVFELAAETGTALEINSDPARLDLKREHAEAALAAGCLLTINCDAHHPDGFGLIEYGVAVARQAWATPDRILNARPADDLREWLRARG